MKIDLGDAIDTVEVLLEELRRMDAYEADESATRTARRERAEAARTLLYLSHLGDMARVQIMDAYFSFKGEGLPD